MGSDRARVSYDKDQQYRSVVMQQGRVTLEADWNESQQIASEELRHETLDIVGPVGTPDDGYKVILSSKPTTPSCDFQIQRGTMYVGGVRASQSKSVRYSHQSEWLDASDDPDWVDPAKLAQSPPTAEFVYLLLREQEVSAVEDSDLKDVALGGPDTAQRTRLIQHIARLSSQATACASGLAAAEAKWDSEGLDFNPATMRLLSRGRLEVGFSGQSGSNDPCQPQNQGGYLGADNQLIRVQISGVDSASGNPAFLWGYDDASFLYRVDLNSATPQVVHLQSAPVDVFHQPRSGQTVEVLRSAALLHNGEYVASTGGIAATLTAAYDPDSQTITLPSPTTLTSEYFDATLTPRAFLRVWEEQKVFTPGTPVVLGTTGLQVTLKLESGKVFHTGDYWLFAARPSTPQEVYPERYLTDFQPPEGPRLWACPLAVISWSERIGTLASDCRIPFCHLTDACNREQGCCTITVAPQDITGDKTLQTIVNKASRPTMLVEAANPGAPGNNIAVAISDLQLNATQPTFDLTVTETDIYLGLTVNGSTDGIEVIIGDEEGGPNDGLAHILVGSLNTKLVPLNNQTVTFAGGQGNVNALANFMDSSNQNVAFTLQARGPGVDGNLTQATISNLDSSSNPPTFALTVTWQKTLPGLNMATLFSSIQTSMGYEIVATPPTTVAPSCPAEGVTQLTGGAEPDPATQTNATTAQAGIFGNPAKICLGPGSYPLLQPLVLGPEQSNITIEACAGATITAAQSDELKQFITGMIQLNGANNVTLRGLTFAMPRVLLFQSGSSLAGLQQSALEGIGEAALVRLDTSVALMVSGCQGLTVEDCRFSYPGIRLDEILFAAGIFAGADCADISLKGNLFEGPAAIKAVGATAGNVPAFALASGYVQADSLQTLSLGAAGGGTAVSGGTLVPSTLNNIIVSGNSFENLAFPVAIVTALGSAKFEANVMRSCLSGFTILPLVASVAGANQMAANDVVVQTLSDSSTQRMVSIAVAYPRPVSFVPKRQIVLAAAKTPAAPTSTAPSQPARLASGRVFTAVKEVPLSAALAEPGSAAVARAVPVGAAPAAPTAPSATPMLKLQNMKPFTAHVAQFMSQIAATNIGITQFGRDISFSVQFSHNDVDAFVAGGGSLWALTILDVAALISALGGTPGPNTETTFGILNLTGNKLRSTGVGPLAFTVSAMVEYCSATGNVILNERGERGASLSIVVFNAATPPANVALAAVTGNVLMGRVSLPPRTAATLPDWATYNCVRP